jgi:hypothetical protein
MNSHQKRLIEQLEKYEDLDDLFFNDVLYIALRTECAIIDQEVLSKAVSVSGRDDHQLNNIACNFQLYRESEDKSHFSENEVWNAFTEYLIAMSEKCIQNKENLALV